MRRRFLVCAAAAAGSAGLPAAEALRFQGRGVGCPAEQLREPTRSNTATMPRMAMCGEAWLDGGGTA